MAASGHHFPARLPTAPSAGLLPGCPPAPAAPLPAAVRPPAAVPLSGAFPMPFFPPLGLPSVAVCCRLMLLRAASCCLLLSLAVCAVASPCGVAPYCRRHRAARATRSPSHHAPGGAIRHALASNGENRREVRRRDDRRNVPGENHRPTPRRPRPTPQRPQQPRRLRRLRCPRPPTRSCAAAGRPGAVQPDRGGARRLRPDRRPPLHPAPHQRCAQGAGARRCAGAGRRHLDGAGPVRAGRRRFRGRGAGPPYGHVLGESDVRRHRDRRRLPCPEQRPQRCAAAAEAAAHPERRRRHRALPAA